MTRLGIELAKSALPIEEVPLGHASGLANQNLCKIRTYSLWNLPSVTCCIAATILGEINASAFYGIRIYDHQMVRSRVKRLCRLFRLLCDVFVNYIELFRFLALYKGLVPKLMRLGPSKYYFAAALLPYFLVCNEGSYYEIFCLSATWELPLNCKYSDKISQENERKKQCVWEPFAKLLSWLWLVIFILKTSN